jgi:hypothetical protein
VSKRPDYLLKETIDGGNGKMRVIMKQQVQNVAGFLAENCCRCFRFFGEKSDVVRLLFRSKLMQLPQNSAFHFGSSLVGKSDGQDVPVFFGIFKKQSNELPGDGECFTGTGRSSVYMKFRQISGVLCVSQKYRKNLS